MDFKPRSKTKTSAVLPRATEQGFYATILHTYVPLIAQLVKNLPAMQEIPVRFLGWEDPFQLSWASLVAQLVRIYLQCGRPGFNPWVGKIPWRRKGYPLLYSDLENSMDCMVHGVAKSQTRLSNFHFHFLLPYMGGLFRPGHLCLLFMLFHILPNHTTINVFTEHFH